MSDKKERRRPKTTLLLDHGHRRATTQRQSEKVLDDDDSRSTHVWNASDNIVGGPLGSYGIIILIIFAIVCLILRVGSTTSPMHATNRSTTAGTTAHTHLDLLSQGAVPSQPPSSHEHDTISYKQPTQNVQPYPHTTSTSQTPHRGTSNYCTQSALSPSVVSESSP